MMPTRDGTWVTPPAVVAPATLYLCSAAGNVSSDALASGAELLRARGFATRHNPARFDTPPYLAGPDADRLRDLTEALTGPGIEAALFARGGYGTMRLLADIPFEAWRDAPRWLVGYSDMTAISLAAARHGIPTIHGPMVASLARHLCDRSLESLVAALAGAPVPLEGLVTLQRGRASGRLLGGNLTMIAALLGTPYLPSLDGSVLLIEEVGEAPYRIDRAWTQLLLSGALDGIAGIAFGQFTRCGSSTGLELASALAARLPRSIPMVAGLPVGHGEPNLALVHGAVVTLDAEAGTLVTEPIPGAAARVAARPEPDTAALPVHLPRPGRPGVAPLLRGPGLSGAAALLRDALDAGIFTGVQLVAWRGAEPTHRLSLGVTAATPGAELRPVGPDTRFDVASATKAVSTALLAHIGLAEGRFGLDEEIPGSLSVSRPTLADLLRHASGLPAYERVFESPGITRDDALRRFSRIGVDEAWRGRGRYSDVGYIALGRWIERTMEAPLNQLFEQHIARPLGLVATGFRPPGSTPAQGGIAATEHCPWRDRVIQGEVHDENAALLGGIAGHAGLFSTAWEIAAIGRALLAGAPLSLTREAIVRMWNPAWIAAEGSHTLGWDTPSGERPSAGNRMSRDATVGHLGFTGCSLWIDREHEVVVSLLTNRVHPTRNNTRIREVRPALHDAVMRELGF